MPITLQLGARRKSGSNAFSATKSARVVPKDVWRRDDYANFAVFVLKSSSVLSQGRGVMNRELVLPPASIANNA
jgi:hypothetical protein